MPAPLEQLLMRKCGIRYQHARTLVAEARREIGMEARAAWTQELFDLCVRRVEAETAKDKGDAGTATTSSSSSSSSSSTIESEASTTETPAQTTTAGTATETPETAPSASKPAGGSNNQITAAAQKMRTGQKHTETSTPAKAPYPKPVNKGNFQQPKPTLAPFRSCSSTLESFRNCSSDHGLVVGQFKPQMSSEDLVPMNMPKNSLRREAPPLLPGSLRGRLLLDSLHKGKPMLHPRYDDDDDDDSTESDTSYDSMMEFASDNHVPRVTCI